MYCCAERLSEIRDELVGMKLQEIYPDWAHGIIYFRFEDGLSTKIAMIKNNYYSGIDILKSAKINKRCNVERNSI